MIKNDGFGVDYKKRTGFIKNKRDRLLEMVRKFQLE